MPYTDRYVSQMLRSDDLDRNPDSLQARLHKDGYLYLPGVLSPDVVLSLRADYFSRFDPSLFAPGTNPIDGVFSGHLPVGLPPYGLPGHPAYEFARSPAFKRFVNDPVLSTLAEKLLGKRVKLVPRQLPRHYCRASPRASRAHRDSDYMAAAEVVTMWIPIGPCPLATGGLAYLKGSHTMTTTQLASLRGITDRPGDPRPISHDLGFVARSLKSYWLVTDYEPGDISVHLPQTIHASLDNISDVMRLSIDIRFVPTDADIDPDWREQWSGDDGSSFVHRREEKGHRAEPSG
ncbi:phytanoyl-CoA dioxygenase family protein [Streptomyces violascens]|uniref:phytanoyl-CoA dioxygenase family protein n=1 Tax=Streptomyces violascens TaxID=67381 RepID=UPI0036B18BA5